KVGAGVSNAGGDIGRAVIHRFQQFRTQSFPEGVVYRWKILARECAGGLGAHAIQMQALRAKIELQVFSRIIGMRQQKIVPADAVIHERLSGQLLAQQVGQLIAQLERGRARVGRRLQTRAQGRADSQNSRRRALIKRTAVGIVVWNLIPQESGSEFSHSSRFGAVTLISFADLQRFEGEDERRIGGFKIQIEIPHVKALREIAGLLELARTIPLDLADMSSDVEIDFEVTEKTWEFIHFGL